METLLDGVNHIALLTRDMDRFIRFYQEVFDAQVVHDNGQHGGHVGERMVIMALGGQSAFNVFEVPGNTQAQMIQTPMFGRGRLDHFGLNARNRETFEQARTRLMHLGASDGTITDFGSALSVSSATHGLEAEVVWNKDPETLAAGKSHRLKRCACDGYGDVPRGDVGHFPITTGSEGIPGATWVTSVVTGCFYRLSPRVTADAASLEKVM